MAMLDDRNLTSHTYDEALPKRYTSASPASILSCWKRQNGVCKTSHGRSSLRCSCGSAT